MKIILTLISLIVLGGIIYPQINEITKLPLQNFSEQVVQTTPLWISESDILIFFSSYSNSDKSQIDTIYSVRSTNRGKTWSGHSIQVIDTSDSNHRMTPTAIITKNNRILLLWSNPYVTFKLIYSDDFGSTWSDPKSFVVRDPLPLRFREHFRFTEVTNGELLLSFSTFRSYFIKSTDGGITWQTDEPFYFGSNKKSLSIIETGVDSLLAVYSSNDCIFSEFSTDNGLTWNNSSFIDSLSNANNSLHIAKRADGSLVIVYDAFTESLPHYQYANDIFIKESFDKGMSWTNAVSFTRYLGNDESSNITSLGSDVFISFLSERDPGIYYGIIDESEDKFTPPLLKSQKTVNIDYENDKLGFQAEVIDDEGVSRVMAMIDQINFTIELFDDGMHNDSLPNDNIFGNTLPIITEGYQGGGYAMDLNNISLPFSSKGVIADMNIEYKGFSFELEMTDISGNVGLTGAGVRIPIRGGGGSMGKFDEGGFLFSGGFVLSGYSNGEMWSNAVASAMLVEDYLPGLIGSELYDPLNGIYVVNKRDPSFSYTWQKWKDAVSLGAEFYDGDGDGIYNPVDKNWNGTWDLNEDMPPLIGDEIAWCVYNDGLPRNQRRWNTVEPQGIEVRQTIFATDNPELENVIFIRYSILNTGSVAEVLDSVYFGVWEDADVGDATDDVVGCDTLLQSGFYYANTPDLLYGDNPPSFFTSLLQGPVVSTNSPSDTAKNNFGQQIGTETFSNSINLDITSHIFFMSGNPIGHDPHDATEARYNLLGKTRLNEYVNPCNFVYCQVRGGVNCNEVNPKFWGSGDPVTNIGWISTQQRDYRNLIGTGPFQLEKDIPQEIIIAYVIGRGNDPLNSVTVARENVQRAIQEYQSNFASMTYSPPPAIPVTSYLLYQNYPNPFNPITTIRYELPQDGVVTIEVFDILGQKVKTLLNEFKRADRYEVTFNSVGLASGVYIYRLKVNDFITSKKMVLIR
jgi:hypothetical protein